ncbi:MAG: hypothetical protein ACOYJ6_19885, partial [Caulobacterales bacterium]
MATVTSVIALEWVAKLLGEDRELLEAILSNDDNLTYGSIITVHTGPDETITALTQDGVEELRDMLANARRSPRDWESFLESFLSDPELIERLK